MKEEQALESILTYGSYIGRDRTGALQIDGCEAEALAKEFGTPLWVISERTIRDNYRHLTAAFRKQYPSTEIAYASKANPQPAIIRLVGLEGGRVDAVTAGHIEMLLAGGLAPTDIIFNGNNKTLEELRWALQHGVHVINADSLEEVQLLAELQPPSAPPAAIALRLAIDPAPHLEDDSAFGLAQESFKFGMDEPEALAAARVLHGHPALTLAGLHNHVGFSAYGLEYSAELDLKRHRRCVNQVIGFARQLKQDLGVHLEHINLGGGYRKARPHGYGPKAIINMPSADEYAAEIAGTIARSVERYQLGTPRLILEAGGYIVADAVVLLATVGFTKIRRTVSGMERWAFLDNTSAYHFVRRLMYGFHHHVMVAGRSDGSDLRRVNIGGPICTDDTVAWNVPLPPLKRGDIVAVLDQGAYCEAVTSDFCGVPIPAAVLACDGVADVIRKRETASELVSKFSVPGRLKLDEESATQAGPLT